MESVLVNSILTSVSCDFALSEVFSSGMPSPTKSESSSTSNTSSGYSSSDEGDMVYPPTESEQSGCRNILDLYSNLTSKQYWPYRASVLPKRDIKMFLTNRSVYHRCEGFKPEISGMDDCKFCGFPVPVIL